MGARKTKGTKEIGWSDQTRARIQTSMIVNRLTDHIRGEVELSSTQVTAALGLLKKAIPDLAAVQHSGELMVRNPAEVPDNELAHIATSRSEGTAETTRH